MESLLLSDERVTQPKSHPKDLLISRIAWNTLKAEPGGGGEGS